MSHPERIVPDETEPGILALHLKRYEFAAPWCEAKDVLDAGCGVGYGTAFLAQSARRVVGVDVDEEAIAYARRRYAAPNVEFVHADLLELDLPDIAFDVVCSFETIEHVDDQERFVELLARVLRPDGVALVSTPRVDHTNRAPENPFHRVELSRADFEQLLRIRFDEVELYGQRRLETRRHRLLRRLDVFGLRRRLPVVRRASRLATGTTATEYAASADVVIAPDGLDRAAELVAVARRPRP